MVIYIRNKCKKCPDKIRGKCCYYSVWIDNHLIRLYKLPCILLNEKTGRCEKYSRHKNRKKYSCLSIRQMRKLGSLPKGCLYDKEGEAKQEEPFPENFPEKLKVRYHAWNNTDLETIKKFFEPSLKSIKKFKRPKNI